LMLAHASVRGRMRRDLGGLAGTTVGDRSVNAGSSRVSRGRSANRSLAGSRGGRVLRWLRRETGGRRPLGILLLKRRLVLRRRWRGGRRNLQSGRVGSHMGRLLLRLGRWWWSETTALATLARHYCAKHVVSHADIGRRLLRGPGMLRGQVHAARRATTGVQLAAQHSDLLFVSARQTDVSLSPAHAPAHLPWAAGGGDHGGALLMLTCS